MFSLALKGIFVFPGKPVAGCGLVVGYCCCQIVRGCGGDEPPPYTFILGGGWE